MAGLGFHIMNVFSDFLSFKFTERDVFSFDNGELVKFSLLHLTLIWLGRKVKLFFYRILSGRHTLLPTFLNSIKYYLLSCNCSVWTHEKSLVTLTCAICWILYASSCDKIYCLNTISMHLYILHKCLAR